MSQRIIAMWSGPRNISTALMRSWASRADTRVIDEPFYAHYLQQTGYNHPGAQEIIDHYETDWRQVVDLLLANGTGEAIFYQKHMTQHMLEHIDRTWLLKISNCFLIRDPVRMLKSFAKVIPSPQLDQTGLPQQLELFNTVRQASGTVPPVIRARDVLLNPEASLRHLCRVLDVPYDPAMLSWKAGAHSSDGIWAKHWYGSVERSTGFAPYREDDTPLPKHLRGLLAECQALYDQMARYCAFEAAR
ncbi:MAG: HAD family hydrolase [Chloroflexi bacterium]|nr:HAD family hydrolase [Chloroflexota bacterium]